MTYQIREEMKMFSTNTISAVAEHQEDWKMFVVDPMIDCHA